VAWSSVFLVSADRKIAEMALEFALNPLARALRSCAVGNPATRASAAIRITAEQWEDVMHAASRRATMGCQCATIIARCAFRPVMQICNIGFPWRALFREREGWMRVASHKLTA